MRHGDARMLALTIIDRARRQELPEFPLSERKETGFIGYGPPPYPSYEWDRDRLVIAGQQFSVRELCAALDRLEQMARQASAQLELFPEAA